MGGRLARWVRAWPARRVALAVVAGLLVVSAAWLGGQGPVGAQDGEGEAAADPKSVAEVRISGLSGTLTYGGRDSFTVTASNLTTVVGYDVIVSRNNSTLGIGACGTGSQTQRVSGVTSQNLSFTVHGCGAGSGTVMAVVRRTGLTTNEDTASQGVTVQARAPATPARPTAPNPKAREFTAQWQAPGDTGGTALTGYHVIMRPNGAAWPPDREAKKVGASTRRQRFSGLTPNRIYWFKIKACNGANQTRCSGWSPQASVTLPIGRPREPTWGSFTAESTQIRVTWSAPGDTGGVGLTGYGLRHWRKGATEPSNAEVVVNAQTSARTFGGLAANTGYRFSIQACNGPSRCSGWTNKDGTTKPTPTPPPPPPAQAPDRVEQPTFSEIGSTAFTVTWSPPRDNGTAIRGYGIQWRQSGSGWPSTTTWRGASARSERVDNRAAGTTYVVRVKACNGTGANGRNRCGAWSRDGRVTTLAETAGPQNLNVVPRAGRRVVLTWDAVSGAARYEVQARVLGPSEENGWHAAECQGVLGDGPIQRRCEIELEHITTVDGSELGLQDHEAYALQVRVLKPQKGDFSATVILIDTPITKANGANSQAEITWQPVDKAVADLGANFTGGSYQLRYRKADADVHRESDWTPSKFEDAVTHSTTEQILNAGQDSELRVDVIDAISTVNAGRLYAVQLVYKDDPNSSQDADVFAARNVYVWPSSSAPAAYSYVGGLSLEQRLPSRDVAYRICGDSFGPSGDARRNAWVALIKDAFGQWTEATGGLVNFLEPSDGCATDDVSDQTYVTIRERIKNFLSAESPTPVTPADPDILGHIVEYVSGLSRDGIVSGISDDSRTHSDVYMFDDMSLGPLVHSYAFSEVASDIGYGIGCWFKASGKWDKTRMCTGSNRDADGNVEPPDIIVRRGAYDAGPWSDLEPNEQSDDLRLPVTDARFGTCFNDDSDDWKSAYSDMVHEVGHLIGIAGHPGFSDTVMNYDNVLPDERRQKEPDCSPHPIDIMAVYALYQTGF